LPTPLFAGQCAGRALGDNIARGYVTADTVNSCNLSLPFTPGYFVHGGAGTATHPNVLWGDYVYVNPSQNVAQGDALVHIEASPGVGVNAFQGGYPPGDPETTIPGEYTFYGRYVAWTAADNREPLSSKSAARFINGGAFTGGTSLLVWRDSKVNQGSFLCPAVLGSRPPWYPLDAEELVAFDESETAEALSALPPPFPAAAQRVRVDGPALPVTPVFGWLYLNLNQSNAFDGSNPPEDLQAAQSWVTNVLDAEGRFSVGQAGVAIENAKAVTHFCINGGGAPPCP
jgi:hypothetical protein